MSTNNHGTNNHGTKCVQMLRLVRAQVTFRGAGPPGERAVVLLGGSLQPGLVCVDSCTMQAMSILLRCVCLDTQRRRRVGRVATGFSVSTVVLVPICDLFPSPQLLPSPGRRSFRCLCQPRSQSPYKRLDHGAHADIHAKGRSSGSFRAFLLEGQEETQPNRKKRSCTKPLKPASRTDESSARLLRRCPRTCRPLGLSIAALLVLIPAGCRGCCCGWPWRRRTGNGFRRYPTLLPRLLLLPRLDDSCVSGMLLMKLSGTFHIRKGQRSDDGISVATSVLSKRGGRSVA